MKWTDSVAHPFTGSKSVTMIPNDLGLPWEQRPVYKQMRVRNFGSYLFIFSIHPNVKPVLFSFASFDSASLLEENPTRPSATLLIRFRNLEKQFRCFVQ